MKDFESITVTKGETSLEIHNPTNYSLIGMGAQGAVFQLSEDKCIKIYLDPEHAKSEEMALRAGNHLSFFPKVYDSGQNYIVMDYFNGPTLKEYLRNCTYFPEPITKKLLYILRELKRANFTKVDIALRHIFVTQNQELKVIDHVNSLRRKRRVPIKLLRDLKMIHLKDSFLSQVKKLEPKTYYKWKKYFKYNTLNYEDLNGNRLKADSTIVNTPIGKGLQGAVYRIDEDTCVKIFKHRRHARRELEVLLSSQELPFIPKVYDAGTNYIVMEYLVGPDLNTYLKKQSELKVDITRELLSMLTTMKKSGFKRIDAPLRHIIITSNGFKLVDHVYSFTHKQDSPLTLFQDLQEKQFLDAFLEQVQAIEPETYKNWTKTPIPTGEEIP